MVDLRVRLRKMPQDTILGINQCYLCSTLLKCPYELFKRGDWKPICLECRKKAKGEEYDTLPSKREKFGGF